MRIFVPDQFKSKGSSWKRPLSKKEKRQLKRYSSAFSHSAYAKRGSK